MMKVIPQIVKPLDCVIWQGSISDAENIKEVTEFLQGANPPDLLYWLMVGSVGIKRYLVKVSPNWVEVLDQENYNKKYMEYQDLRDPSTLLDSDKVSSILNDMFGGTKS